MHCRIFWEAGPNFLRFYIHISLCISLLLIVIGYLAIAEMLVQVLKISGKFLGTLLKKLGALLLLQYGIVLLFNMIIGGAVGTVLVVGFSNGNNGGLGAMFSTALGAGTTSDVMLGMKWRMKLKF
jgi:hypothetical protein